MGGYPPPQPYLWSLGVLYKQEGVRISNEESIESLTSRASALTRKTISKSEAVLFPLSPLNFPAATAAVLCAKLHAVNVHLSMIWAHLLDQASPET